MGKQLIFPELEVSTLWNVKLVNEAYFPKDRVRSAFLLFVLAVTTYPVYSIFY